MRSILIVCYLLMSFYVFARSKTTKIVTNAFSNEKIDSIQRIIDQKGDTKIKQVDSATHALYVQVLERTSNIQNNRDTYYSFIIAVLTALMTLMAIAFGVNWFSRNLSHKKEMKRITAMYNKAIADQNTTFNSLVSKLQGDIKLIGGLKKFFEDSIKDIEEKDRKKYQDHLDTLMNITQSFSDNLFANSTSIQGSGMFIHCRNCNKIIDLERVIPTGLATGAYVEIACPHCGESNPAPATYFKKR